MNRWAVIEPTLQADSELCEVADRLLRMVGSSWSDVPEMAPLDTRVWSFLSRHRVATIIPPDACVAGQRGEFVDRLMNIAASQMRIEATAREVQGWLRETGIETRLLKGLATSYLDYPRPELRHTGDVDLLLPPDRLTDAVGLLRSGGFCGGDESPLAKSTTMRSPRNIEVDLHTRLFRRSEIGDAVLFRGEATSLGWVDALDPTGRLVHAAGHLLLSPPGRRRLSGLFDVTMLVNSSAHDGLEVMDLAKSLRVAPIVGAALELEEALNPYRDVSPVSWPQMSVVQRRLLMGRERGWAAERLNRMFDLAPEQRWLHMPRWMLQKSWQRAAKVFK